ncbi:glycosyltransferase [Olsenella urininfantis]|uniref:glycosyltransferase n=1 Tax=Olsenella urininfantis TaxID=1871033 RepID=UPI000985B737|nr:glycosyltransferase [Olsenella urininfantis]
MAESQEPSAGKLPLLSVLVPICNVERYLRQCLLSLKSQSFQDFEAILLNDGSTDSSGAIAHELAEGDSRLHVVDKPNSGYGSTLNLGLSLARGRYVGFLESDDIMCEGALESLMSAAVENDCDLVRGGFSLYWSSGPRDLMQHPFAPDLIGRVLDPRVEPRLYLCRPAIWSGVFRRSFLEENDILFLETPGASYQDTSFAFKTYAAARRAFFLDLPVIRYRQDNEGSSVRSQGKVYMVKGEFDEIDRWLGARAEREHASDLSLASLVARYNAYLWNVDRIAGEFRAEFMRSMAEEFRALDASGRIEWARLDGWRALNLRSIMSDPQRYLALRERFRSSGSISKLVFALSLGGPAAVAAALRERRGR